MLFLTLALLISFPTVNATLFVPVLPELTLLLQVSEKTMELSVLGFLAGYALGQLLYTPIENRLGQKSALFVGIAVQIISSLTAILACYYVSFNLFFITRFCLALGSGVGLMMTFTIVSQHYAEDRVKIIISYLIPAFAIVPAIGVILSGYLTERFGWASNFCLSAGYGILMLYLCSLLSLSKHFTTTRSFEIKKTIQLLSRYLQCKSLIISGMLMGICVSFVYIFSTIAPFFTATYLQMTSVEYGLANGFSSIGLVMGAVIGAKMSFQLSHLRMITLGIIAIFLGSLSMLMGEYFIFSAFLSFFLPLFIINFGSCFVLAHASSLILGNTQEKSSVSAVLSFVNVGTSTVLMLAFSYLTLGHYLLSITFIGLSLIMIILLLVLNKYYDNSK